MKNKEILMSEDNITIQADKITVGSIDAKDFDPEKFLFEYEFKSKIKLGTAVYFIQKKFNKFQKFMLKICFGIEVEDI